MTFYLIVNIIYVLIIKMRDSDSVEDFVGPSSQKSKPATPSSKRKAAVPTSSKGEGSKKKKGDDDAKKELPSTK